MTNWLKKSILITCLSLAFVFYFTSVQASILKFEKGIGWASFRDLTSEQFSTKFNEYRKDYILIDSDAYQVGNNTRYAMVWRKNTDNRGWAAYRNMSSDGYHQRWEEFKNKGYRPTDIESYQRNGQQQYAGIWVQNKEGLGWSSRRNLTASEYGNYFREQNQKGYKIVDVEVYQTSGGLRYAAIWVQNKDNVQWAQFRDMSRSAYQEKVNEYGSKGYMLVDYESYKVGSSQRFAAIWEKRSGYGYQVRTNRTETAFANLWRTYRDEGYRLVDFERYTTPDGDRYAGIWIENESRFRYSKKGQLDDLIKKYRSDNSLPGISVAVVKDGKMLYRRGFGEADKEAKKVAHGESVYLSASISKVVGGTIAAKLQQAGRLDFNKTTRSYLTNIRKSDGTTVTLPARHQHTVGQLFAHLGCIQAYEGPEPSTQQYNRAIDALTQIWNAPFVSNCTRGSNWSYSTHGFTYLAAVLEKITGKTSAQLIESEIANPYGLSSMRALYASSSVPFNYERVKPYNRDNTPTTFENNSWKVFGGGIEASPVDLAWFGWKVLDGKIVSKSTRDNVLWKKVNSSSNSNHGIAWVVNTRNGRRVAEHNGIVNGTRTNLRVYRDNGLVVVVMMNRRQRFNTNSNLDISTLTENIANIIL
ncbi:MAG: serine hydrolase [Saprospiraceae bacterium]